MGGGMTMYCVLCGYPTDSRYAEGIPYVDGIGHLNNIVVFLKDSSFTGVGSADADDGWGWVEFPDGTSLNSFDYNNGVLREMMGSNGVNVYEWLCDNVDRENNNSIDGYYYDEYTYDERHEQYWFDICPSNKDDDVRENPTMALFYASPNIDGFVYYKSVIDTVSDTEPSVLNLIFDLVMFDMFIDYKDAIALAGTSKLMRGQVGKDKRYWKRVHNYRKLKLDEDLNFGQMVQKLHSPNVMKRSRLQYTVQYILDRCTVKRQKLH
ncbi:hypothetical protein GQ42DRAFT_157230 [Ramicandelaber brevisporus]|nr:hypothetical protein GQ42DRAFT_157230 [Ramicandelaber brevisporus]